MPPKNNIQFSSYGPATIAGGAGLLSGALGMIGNAIANRQNIQNWQMQNLFNQFSNQAEIIHNLPKNQVRRLLDAGINPNLIAGGSSASTANMPQADNVAAANPLSFGGLATAAAAAINQYWHAREFDLKEKIADAQINLMGEQAKNQQNMAFLNLWKGTNQKYDYEGKLDIGYWDLYSRKVQKDINLLAAKTIKQNLENSFLESSFDMRLDAIDFKNQLANQMKSYYHKLGLYYDAQTDVAKENKDLVHSRKDLVDEQVISQRAINSWNEMTLSQRKALLNAYVAIASTNANYADTNAQLSIARNIESLILEPLNTVAKFIPNIGNFLNLATGSAPAPNPGGFSQPSYTH